MCSVATGAVGYDLRAESRREAVVAREIGRGTAALDAELLGEPHSFVAARTSNLREILCGYRRVGIGVRFDGVNPVTIGTDGRLPVRFRERLAVNALLKLFRDLIVALAAGQRHIELKDG